MMRTVQTTLLSSALLTAVLPLCVIAHGSANAAFDAVTAELQVNLEGVAPLLCVTGVHDVASGDLSLPGRIVEEK